MSAISLEETSLSTLQLHGMPGSSVQTLEQCEGVYQWDMYIVLLQLCRCDADDKADSMGVACLWHGFVWVEGSRPHRR